MPLGLHLRHVLLPLLLVQYLGELLQFPFCCSAAVGAAAAAAFIIAAVPGYAATALVLWE